MIRLFICLWLLLISPIACLAQDEKDEKPVFSENEAPPTAVTTKWPQAPAHPATAYWNVTAHLTLAAVTPETHIKMLLPLSDGRQSILTRRTQTQGVRYWEEADGVNLWGHWQMTGIAPVPQQITYDYTVQITDTRTMLPHQPFPFQNLVPEAIPYLAASEMIQSDRPQVQQHAWRIVQKETRLDPAVRKLYHYIAGFLTTGGKAAPNDALAVLTTERGGWSGKTRALVALLRAVGIPARVVGGIRLGDTRQKRTTIYWAEAFLGETWVPMDPAGGYFGWLPHTYLALYRNDLPLLVHTQHVSVAYTFVIRPLTRSAAFAIDPQGKTRLHTTQQGQPIKSERLQTVAAYVDRPRASVVLINEGPLPQLTVDQILAQAQEMQVNIALFSTDVGARALRESHLQYLVDSNLVLIQEANLVLLNTVDAAGLYALLKQGRFGVSLPDLQLVIASGVAQPVGTVFASVLFQVLAPATVLLVPHQPDPMQLWELARVSVHEKTGLAESAARFPIPSVVVDADSLSGLSWWRRWVVNIWAQAIQAHVSLPALNAILVLPLIAFFLVVMRNVIGLETFGFFAPMLLALAFLTTGLGWGLLIFGIIVGIGGGLRLALQQLRLHLVARVAILIAVVAVSMAGLTVIGATLGIGPLLHVGIFPMVIIANIIENFTNTQMERGTLEALRLTLNTLLVALASHVGIENTDLRPLVLAFPELLMAVMGVEVLLGCWRGLRLMEYIRFARVLRQAETQQVR